MIGWTVWGRGRLKERRQGKAGRKKSSAADSFGVAQSPKSPRGGTEVIVQHEWSDARKISQKNKKLGPRLRQSFKGKLPSAPWYRG